MFTRHVLVGYSPEGSVFVTIRYRDERLSMIGVTGPDSRGNARGSCGQILDTLAELTIYGPELNKEIVDKLKEVWGRWHLNDMRSGTPAQEEFLRNAESPAQEGYLRQHYAGKHNYDTACKLLEEAGLNPDNGYKYGTKWLFEKVPDDVIEFLKSLPETNLLPPIWRK